MNRDDKKIYPGRISTLALLKSFEDPKLKLVDIRPADAYNGWKMRGESRGGHIRRARSLPAAWAEYIDWTEIVRSKGLNPEDYLVIYGYDRENILKVARQFIRSGYRSVRVYYDFVEEWSANDDLPLDRLHRYRNLVPAEWLNSLISRSRADEYGAEDFVICHAHYRNRGDYEEGHIPGAVELDTNSLESQKTWNCRSAEEIEHALLTKGIRSDTTVILYGRFSFPDNSDPFPGSSAGHLGAMRAAFIMLYAGVRDIRILNGGIQSWIDAGYELERSDAPASAASDFGDKIPQHPDLVTGIDRAREILSSEDSNLVSVRSWPEYTGEVSGYNYIEKKGRIPGSVFGNCGSDAYHMENYRNLDHTMREYHEVERIWSEAGITPERHNAFYCGTGWRASEAFFNAWLMGWPEISVFDGGWYEWSSDPDNPIETGDPE
jgi:thiosulfate/3-mercaptopyruvate sulfurtransferase